MRPSLLLTLLPAAAGLATPLRAPGRSAVGVPARPVLAAHGFARASLARMAEEAAQAPPAQELCLETGEEVEECTLMSWDAGKITAPQALIDKVKLGARPCLRMHRTEGTPHIRASAPVEPATSPHSPPPALPVPGLPGHP